MAALVRCVHKNYENIDHGATLKTYATDILTSHKFSKYFLPPANMYLNQQGRLVNSESFTSGPYYPDNIKHCLEIVPNKKGQRVTIAHYLKHLREWATYEDSYLFFRLYGPGIRSSLDRYLRTIGFFYLAQTEYFLIRAIGLGAVKLQYDYFVSELKKNLGTDSPRLTARFSVYEQMLSS